MHMNVYTIHCDSQISENRIQKSQARVAMPDVHVEEHISIHSLSEQELRRWFREDNAGQLVAVWEILWWLHIVSDNDIGKQDFQRHGRQKPAGTRKYQEYRVVDMQQR